MKKTSTPAQKSTTRARKMKRNGRPATAADVDAFVRKLEAGGMYPVFKQKVEQARKDLKAAGLM